MSQSIHREDTAIGAVPVRHYIPSHPSPWTMVFSHGGGFSWGTLDDYDPIASNLCAATGARVFSVGYRLAPEHPFPAGLDDVCAVLRALGRGRPTGPLIVAGDSAGACLAAGAAQRMRDESGLSLAAQLLIYPMLEYHDRTPAGFHTLSDQFHPSFKAVRNAWDTYLPPPRDMLPAYAVPTRAASLAGLPPALTMVAENDPLRFEAMSYAAELAAAGVPSQFESYDGTAHGFLNDPPRDAVAQALADIAAWLASLER